ncbi:MAG: NAD(P)-binding domain-containing protein [Steroidobacteraceae bacterium]
MDGSSVDVTIDASIRPEPPIPRVAIIGPGLVGAMTAYALLMSGVAGEIVLIGRDRDRVEEHVKELSDAALYSRPTRIVAGDFSYCATADVIIVAVGVAQHRFAGSRLDDLKNSAEMVKHVMTDITRQLPTGVVVIATNPVDVLTYAAWKWSGLPAGRLIGSGTILDSSRQALRRIVDSARRGGQDIRQAKGGTNYGISAALTRIAMAILRDEGAVLTVSTAIPEHMGLGQVSLSVPAIIGREGVQRVLPIRLSDEEDRALRRSAHILERHIATLDLSAEGSIAVNHSRANSSVGCANTSSWT